MYCLYVFGTDIETLLLVIFSYVLVSDIIFPSCILIYLCPCFIANLQTSQMLCPTILGMGF